MEGTSGHPVASSIPVDSPESASTEPTERSMPAVRMTRVCAIARVPTTATCWVISDRLAGARKRSLSSPNTSTATTSCHRGLRTTQRASLAISARVIPPPCRFQVVCGETSPQRSPARPSSGGVDHAALSTIGGQIFSMLNT